MKKTKNYIALFACLIFVNPVFGQDFEGKLTEAKTAYNNGNLDDARFALQQALNEVNVAIGKEILLVLPKDMGGLNYREKEDNISGANIGFAGLYVSRAFSDAKNDTASIVIISDSPLLAGINAILNMPAIMTSGDPNQKRIKVDGYKALLQKNDPGDGKISWEVQVPFNNSLLTFHFEGGKTESEITALANTIPVSKIANLAK